MSGCGARTGVGAASIRSCTAPGGWRRRRQRESDSEHETGDYVTLRRLLVARGAAHSNDAVRVLGRAQQPLARCKQLRRARGGERARRCLAESRCRGLSGSLSLLLEATLLRLGLEIAKVAGCFVVEAAVAVGIRAAVAATGVAATGFNTLARVASRWAPGADAASAVAGRGRAAAAAALAASGRAALLPRIA